MIATKPLRSLIALILFSMTFLLAPPAQAADAPDARCRALETIEFSTVRDAPFKVMAASVVSDAMSPAYCRVEGYVYPEISFEIRLPLAGWNQGFVLTGSGGWANHKSTFLCKEPLAKGYACLMGDAGHRAGDGLWMQANPQAKIDWGYLATHKKTLAGKALVVAFYGRAPDLSLMIGCSTGGYQALVEAQRFPWDFGGIVAIAPDIDEGDLSMRTAWAARNLVADGGMPMFSAADLMVLHRAALAACDDGDGLGDGIIGNPMACRFDPDAIACTTTRASSCLSARQVLAARRIYAGPTTSTGEPLSTAGPFPGSELMWPNILEDVRFAQDYFRFALAEFPRDGFSAAKFDFDEDYRRLGLGGTFVSSNPDLRRFKQAGGKLLIVQGTNDVTEQAHAAIDYYQTVERVSGGRRATQDFARLFVVPGMNHCSGGDGAFAVDWFAAMARWAGEHEAPAVVIGAHVPEWSQGEAGIDAGITAPSPAQKVTFTRPIYPFPTYARYVGHGDASMASSFRPVEVGE